MSARFERCIQEWYSAARTADLDFLDLSGLQKPSPSQIANNLAVIYDRLNLHSRVCIKDSHKQLELFSQIEAKLEVSFQKIEKQQKELQKLIELQKPLSKTEVLGLVEEIAQQPKLVEQEALRLTEKLEKLSIQTDSESVKIPKKKQFPFYVVKDPLQIYKEELGKTKS